MKTKILFAVSLFVSVSAFATPQKFINHDDVSDPRECFRGVFENYGSWAKMMREKGNKRPISDEAKEKRYAGFKKAFPKKLFNHYKKTIDCQTFVYDVDGVEVLGYVVKPKNAENLPVLIFNRGGNGNYGGMVFGALMRGLFPMAEKGFVIVGSQYRGTFKRNSEHKDEFGGADVQDVVKIAELAKYVEGGNANRIGMYGSSRGGMQTFLAAKQLDHIDAIAVINGVSDLERGLEERISMENVYKKRIPNYDTQKEQELAKRSVLNWAHELDKEVPVLIIAGELDKRVSVNQSKTLANKLTELAHPHKLVVYKEEGHSIIKNKADKENKLTDWFNTHLK